jgi:hypothetical protein
MSARSPLIALLSALALVAAGCGGGGGAGGETGEEAGPIGTVEADPSEQAGTEPQEFESSEFEPPLAFTLPAGWRISEDFGVQAYRGDTDRWALTFESEADAGTVADNVEAMRGSTDFIAKEPEPATIGGYEGLTFEAEVENNASIDGSMYFGVRHSQMRIWVVDVDGTLVRIFAEAGAQRKDLRDPEGDAAFFRDVKQILESLEFRTP